MAKKIPETSFWKPKGNTMTDAMLEGFLVCMTCGPQLDKENVWANMVWEQQFWKCNPKALYQKDFEPMQNYLQEMAQKIRKSELDFNVFSPRIFQNPDLQTINEWFGGFCKGMEMFPCDWSELSLEHPNIIDYPRQICRLFRSPVKSINKIQRLIDGFPDFILKATRFFHRQEKGKVNKSHLFFDSRLDIAMVVISTNVRFVFDNLISHARFPNDKPLQVSIEANIGRMSHQGPYLGSILICLLVFLDREEDEFVLYKESIFIFLDWFLFEMARLHEKKDPIAKSILEGMETGLQMFLNSGSLSYQEVLGIAHLAKRRRVHFKSSFHEPKPPSPAEKSGRESVPKVLNPEEFQNGVNMVANFLQLVTAEEGLDEFELAYEFEPLLSDAPAGAAQALLIISQAEETPAVFQRLLVLCLMFGNKALSEPLIDFLCSPKVHLHPKDLSRLVIMRDALMPQSWAKKLDRLIRKAPASKVLEAQSRIGSTPDNIFALCVDGSGGLMILLEGAEKNPLVYAGFVFKIGYGLRDCFVHPCESKYQLSQEMREMKNKCHARPESVSFEYLTLILSHFLCESRNLKTDVSLPWLELFDTFNLPIPELRSLNLQDEMQKIASIYKNPAVNLDIAEARYWLDEMSSYNAWFTLDPQIIEIGKAHKWKYEPEAYEKIVTQVLEKERHQWAEKAAWFALWASHRQKQSKKLQKEILLAAQFALYCYGNEPLINISALGPIVAQSYVAVSVNEGASLDF